MHGTHSYYDMGVAMVDYVIVIVYALHVCGPLVVQLFIVHWVIKRRQQRQFALEIQWLNLLLHACIQIPSTIIGQLK